MELTIKQQWQLEAILVSAFPDKMDLARLVRYGLGQNLGVLVDLNVNLTHVVFQLIEWAHSHNKVLDVLEAAAKINPDHLQLQAFIVELKNEPLVVSRNNLMSRPYHNLSHPDYIHFVGRNSEQDWLFQCLSSDSPTWQIAIIGIGGVGKSALAQAISHKLRERYDDLSPKDRFEAIVRVSAQEEVLTVEGREAANLPDMVFHTLEDIYTAIAQTLEREDITRVIPEQQHHLVQKALSEQRTLLVIENLEKVSDKRVKIFLRNIPPPTKVIITSREWINISETLLLKNLLVAEAQAFIVEESSACHVELNTNQIDTLIEKTHCLPLPIKLSIARLAGGNNFNQVIRWLSNVTGDLADYCVKGQVDLVYKTDQNAWHLLLACSIFHSSAGSSRQALAYITNLSEDECDSGLSYLIKLSLIINQAEDDRCKMLPMVQGYVRAKLAGTDFEDQAIQRWLDWLLSFSQTYGTDLDLHAERSSILSVEYLNLRAAIFWCREHQQWDTLITLTDGTWFFAYLTSLLNDAQEMLESALLASNLTKNVKRQGQFERHLGRLAGTWGFYEKALEDHLARAEQITLSITDKAGLGRTYCIQSSILLYLDRVKEAGERAQYALEIGKDLVDQELWSLASYEMSRNAAKNQRLEEALSWLDEDEKHSREIGWNRGLAWNRYRRGDYQVQLSNVNLAELFFAESLQMASSWEERRLIALNKYRLAQIYASTNRLDRARETAEEGRDICERMGMFVEQKDLEELLQTLHTS
ncbi:MAG: effector-associated domain EAD1-containing protein [Chloroflexota bacterium]|nr:effector-associated domain EAD1-containing protein [Chloroflexota bacterium]